MSNGLKSKELDLGVLSYCKRNRKYSSVRMIQSNPVLNPTENLWLDYLFS